MVGRLGSVLNSVLLLALLCFSLTAGSTKFSGYSGDAYKERSAVVKNKLLCMYSMLESIGMIQSSTSKSFPPLHMTIIMCWPFIAHTPKSGYGNRVTLFYRQKTLGRLMHGHSG